MEFRFCLWSFYYHVYFFIIKIFTKSYIQNIYNQWLYMSKLWLNHLLSLFKLSCLNQLLRDWNIELFVLHYLIENFKPFVLCCKCLTRSIWIFLSKCLYYVGNALLKLSGSLYYLESDWLKVSAVRVILKASAWKCYSEGVWLKISDCAYYFECIWLKVTGWWCLIEVSKW